MPIRSGYMTARGAEPGSWVKTDTRDRKWWKIDREFATGNYQMTMTWHHNIPDNMWRDFWNILLVNNWSDEMTEFLYLTGMDDRPGNDYRISKYITKFNNLTKNFGRLKQANAATFQGNVAQIFQKDFTSFNGAWALSDTNYPLTANENETLSTFVSWQSWNIVEGPLNTLRPADPGDEFDDFSGLIPKERSKLIQFFAARRNRPDCHSDYAVQRASDDPKSVPAIAQHARDSIQPGDLGKECRHPRKCSQSCDQPGVKTSSYGAKRSTVLLR